MLYGQRQIFLREVEHVEDTVLLAAVLAVVDGTYHLYDGLALMHHLRLAILSDDGQLALHQYAVVHGYVVVPAQLLASREHILHGHQFRTAPSFVPGFPVYLILQFSPYYFFADAKLKKNNGLT